MRAAGQFVNKLGPKGILLEVRRVQVDFYSSLALTGKGQGIGRAVILGLCGKQPETVDIAGIDARLAKIRDSLA